MFRFIPCFSNYSKIKMMDLEEDDWEYLPDAAAYRLLLRSDSDADDTLAIPLRSPSSPSVFHMDYFSTTTHPLPPPPPPPPHPNFFIPLQFPPSPTLRAEDVVKRLFHQQPEQEAKEEVHINSNSNSNTPTSDAAAAANKVFFKNSFAKESIESVDMKFLDSSSSPTATTSPRKKNGSVFDDLFNEDAISRSITLIKSDQVAKSNDVVNWIGEGIIGDDYLINDDEGMIGGGGGLNLWKLGFGGIGAICSFGVAAATMCLILFGNSNKAKQNHKLRFQIYSADDQRMKQVVQQATKFNEAMSAAVRGVPLTRAHITYGGYYDNAL